MKRWTMDLIVTGIENLYALRLPDRPPAEDIQKTTEVWLKSIGSKLGNHLVVEIDAPRIKAAFDHLAATCRRWPAPVDMIDAMPPRPVQRTLPEPPMTDEAQQLGLAKLAEIQKRIAESSTIDAGRK